MKILITGATGFVGKRLVNALLNQGHQIVVLTRNKQNAETILKNANVQCFSWSDTQLPPPLDAIKEIDGVVNLMGENLGEKYWSEEQKVKLRRSRIDSTISLVHLIEQNKTTPLNFFINASAIGIYPENLQYALTESSPLGNHFLANLCQDWENSLNLLTKTKRKVFIRTGIVLGKEGGALKKMLPTFKLGLGGKLGDGKQVMSWIHIDDLIAIYLEAINNPSYEGPFNATSPFPMTNAKFTELLGEALHKPTIFQVPRFILKMALGEMSELVLDSQEIKSEKLGPMHFHYQYPHLNEALKEIFPS